MSTVSMRVRVRVDALSRGLLLCAALADRALGTSLVPRAARLMVHVECAGTAVRTRPLWRLECLAWRLWGRNASVRAVCAERWAVYRVWRSVPHRFLWEPGPELTLQLWCEAEMRRLDELALWVLSQRLPASWESVQWRP